MNLIDSIVRNISFLQDRDESEITVAEVEQVVRDFATIKGQWV
ncbi:MAG: hypothetical protein ACOCXT_06680 [Candidatus Dojkabacteria bacterium]